MIPLILSIVINDITPWLDIKVAAALCHRTQHAMFLRNSGAPSVPAMVWKTESFHIWQGPLPGDLSELEKK
jgi:LmbE family N-acetylglucosaminyl deacetylase